MFVLIKEASNLHDFLFLMRYHLVNLCNEAVGDILDMFLTALQVILGDLFFLLKHLERVVGVSSCITHGDLGILPHALEGFDHFLAPFLGKCGDHDANELTVSYNFV